MFEKFGKMDYEELIRTARAEKDQGDEEALIALVVENGLDREDAEEYMEGFADELATPYMVAVARIEGEMDELQVSGIWEYYAGVLLELCSEDDGLCKEICRKDRELVVLFGRILKEASDKRQQVNKKITEAAGIRTDVFIGNPSRPDVVRIAREYYGEE